MSSRTVAHSTRPRPGQIRAANRRRAALTAAVPAALGFVVLGLVGLLAAGVLVGVVLALVAAVVGWTWCRWAGRPLVLRGIGATAAGRDDLPRVRNVLEGLCASAGVVEPDVVVVEDGAPDALVVGRGPRHVTLAVTRGLAEQLSTIELEGALAHELSLVRFAEVDRATVSVVALAPFRMVLSGPASRRRRRPAAAAAVEADLRAVWLTRYPPGLISALEKISAATRRRAGRGRLGRACGSLWLRGDDDTAITERIEALREL